MNTETVEECRGSATCTCFHCSEVAQVARKALYDMMLQNARTYFKNQAGSDESLNAFDVSEVLAVCLCKSKEEVMVDILQMRKPSKRA